MPVKWAWCVQTWQRHHPDWEYRLWTDEDSRKLIKVHYPDFLNTYDSYSYNIQRADAIRHFILYHLEQTYASKH